MPNRISDPESAVRSSPTVDMSPNQLVRFLNKRPAEFTRNDLIRFIREHDIRMLNFRYPAGDGRLKTLNFVLNSRAYLEKILSAGERADGSSLFPYIDAASSDLYVVPRYRTAFVNPFTEIPTLDVLCSFYDNTGSPLASAPENIVQGAQRSVQNLGYTFYAMGELEYYVIHDKQPLYTATAQRGYHESSPFSKFEALRCEAMQAIAQTGGQVKYGHSEVGVVHIDDLTMEQHEIEFLPVPAEEAADQLVIAKWILRMVAHRRGVTLSFAPKVMVGFAGSGLHIHTMLVKDGKNAMSNKRGITDIARRVIAGYLDLAPSLTAFGNTVPLSYLRLVPHQEAPTYICWGDRNRSVLVRVPLGWIGVDNMVSDANPAGDVTRIDTMNPQTVEFRCPDGSADIHQLLAGLAVAARHGLEMPDALDLAERLYVDVNVFSEQHFDTQARLPQLPASCAQSADELIRRRDVYEKDGVFSPVVIDGVAEHLRSQRSRDFIEKELVDSDLHVM